MERHFELELAGQTIVVETGKYAQQAGGSCVISSGDTMLLVTATTSKEPREGIDFFPLSCDFEEKLYSVGKIPGGFIKREGRPSEKAVLTARLMDRPIRPLFPEHYRNEVQVIATVLSVDTEIPPAILALVGSSVALSISEIPFQGPTGAVVVGMVDGKYVINPTTTELEESALNLTIAGTKDGVMMVEADSYEISEDEMLDAILFGHEEIKKIVAFIEEIQKEIGKEKIEVAEPEIDLDLVQKVQDYCHDRVVWSLDTTERYEREARQTEVKKETIEHFEEEYPESKKLINSVIYDMTKEIIRDKITEQGVRPDGRKADQVRDIWCETGILKRTHGSSVFTRGQTQAMSILTLGPMREAQMLDGIDEEETKRYMHHYNMPPYSVGEARFLRGASRREIGHGALAERAVFPMLPDEEEFPYAIRVVSEVISSNGSTSMASVCASSLALMDGGVPMKKPVAGVAMGLIEHKDGSDFTILTDIQGLEDFLGDMDFKVAGTKDGITAIQMDMKIMGIDKSVMQRALAQANVGRMHILGKMNETLPSAREHLSEFAPKIISIMINPEKIGEVVGPRGKMINHIIDETGVKIDIEDDGTVYIATSDQQAAEKAQKMIEDIVKEVEVGEVYLGKVVRIMPFGAFVELLPGKDGLVHISKLAHEHVKNVEDVVKEGDEVLVKVLEIDEKGRINLTRKDLLPKPEENDKK